MREYEMSSTYDRLYTRRKEAPLWWLNHATDLHASAGALWLAMNEEYSKRFVHDLGLGNGFDMGVACWPVFQMLYGMALELLYKAITVASGDEPQFSHNLIDLAQKAGMDLTENEHSALALLTQFVIWDGRYPVPSKKDSLESHYENAWNFLFDPKPSMEISFRKRNDVLTWASLEPIWGKGLERFFAIFNSTNEIR